jgi:hypothetical protein
MKFMTENQFRDTFIIPILKLLPRCYFFIKQADSVRGIPDIIGCLDGRFFALEVKKSKASMNHPRTKLQEYTIHCIKCAGGLGLFIYPENFEGIMQFYFTNNSNDPKILNIINRNKEIIMATKKPVKKAPMPKGKGKKC